jgi:RNA polymerase sigma-70 factor (ECF subfamily)
MQYLKDRNAVEDLVQDFFVSLWIDAQGLHIRSSLKAYLLVSIKNRCLDYQKHQKVSEKYREYILFSSEKGDSTTDNYLAESELRQAIQRSLDKLSPRCREIFEKSRLMGLSNDEISKQLGISKRTVELQISNSLKVLRKELIEYLPLCLIAWLIG